MTISRLSLTNFKGISETTSIELCPVTLLFGANSAGKSSIFQSLLYAREILERRNTDPDSTLLGGDAVDLGGFRNLVHNHDSELPIVMRFDLNLGRVDLIDYVETEDFGEIGEALSGEANSAWVQLTVSWGAIADEPVQADYEIGINGIVAARIKTDPSSGGRHSILCNSGHPWFGADDEDSDEIRWEEIASKRDDLRDSRGKRFETLFDELRYVLSMHDLGPESHALRFALLAPGQYLLHHLKKLTYLGPIRIVPDRSYRPSRSPDQSRWSSGIAAWDWIHSAPPSQLAELNDWLTRADRLNVGYRVEVKHYKELDTDSMAMVALDQGADFLDNYPMIQKEIAALPTKTRVFLRQEKDFLDVMPQDVGIGISQVIPVVVSTLIPSDGITVIEQPELHIHPAVQVALGDLFISRTHEDAALDKQFIIETHSEHLMLRIMRRMRETVSGEAPVGLDISPETVAVYYVEAGPSGTQIQNLGLDREGRFQEKWPRGFFEEREDEFFGTSKDLTDDLGRLFGE
jgi:hypothetical protein